jgi:hypothetical protein
MKRGLTSMAVAASLAIVTASVPTKAEANPAWLIPALVIGGVVVAATAANAHAYAPAYYAPAGSVYVHPRVASRCQIVRERTARGWRRVEVCR